MSEIKLEDFFSSQKPVDIGADFHHQTKITPEVSDYDLMKVSFYNANPQYGLEGKIHFKNYPLAKKI
jgi:hypothetical protein